MSSLEMTKDEAHVAHVEDTMNVVAADAHLANQEDHETSKWQTLKTNKMAVAWCLFAVWTLLLVSFEGQAGGVVVGIPEFRKDFGYLYNGEYTLYANWQSAFSGGPTASQAIGALSGGYIADFLGRKRTVMVTLVISYVAITMEFVSTTNGLFFGGKLINGFACGILQATLFTYIGEIVPTSLRGLLTCAIAMVYTIGPLLVAVIVYCTGTVETRWAYRAVFCSQYGFAAVSSIFVWFMPESPWWCISRGKEAQALNSLRRLGYRNGEDEKRLNVIKLTLEEVKKETAGVTYAECFRASNLRRTIISIMPLTIQALGGVIFIASYSTYYFQLAGYSTHSSFLLNIIGQTLSGLGNICSWYLIDKLGRRPLILWGTVALTVLLMVTGGLATSTETGMIKGAVALILIYNFLYNISIGASAFTILTEVSTSRLRVKTIAIGIAMQNTFYVAESFILPYLFNPDKANLGAKIAFIFGAFSVLGSIYLWFYQPETAGRTYEELDELFMKRVPAREFKTYVTEAEAKGREEAEHHKH